MHPLPPLALWSALTLAASAAPEPKNLAASSPLPSGNGLAAAFKADVSIASHPSVLFADGFESANTSKWDEPGPSSPDIVSFPNPGNPALGNHCLRVTATLGKNTGGGPTQWFPATNSVFVRFLTRFDSQCDYVHHFVTLRANKGLKGGDKWSGFGKAGLLPIGSERFSTALEPWGDNGRNPPPGRWNFYSYWHEMTPSPDGKFWGNSFSPSPAPPVPKDRWICAEFMLRHNSPGKPDGAQAFWIDGKLLGHWEGINWRTSPSVMANALTVESYFTDRWTTNPTNIVSFDNVVVASAYIGPPAKP